MSTSTNKLPGFRPSIGSIGGILFLLVGWQLVSTQFATYQFPGLVHLVGASRQVLTGQTMYSPVENYGLSLIRIVLGFLIVMTFGSIAGIFMGLNDATEDYLSPVVTILMTVPSVIWAFLAVLWFGLTTFLVPVFVISIIIIPYVMVQMWQGTNDVDQGLLEMASAFKADQGQVWRHILIPHLTPYTFATARLAFTLSWKLSLVAEIFGAGTGVGVIVRNYFLSFKTDMIIAWALPIMLLMFGIERVLQYLETRAYQWQPNAEDKTNAKVVE